MTGTCATLRRRPPGRSKPACGNTSLTKHRNVLRHRRDKAWVVAISRRDRPRTARYFYDGAHGGTARALALALAYRDRQLRRLPPATRAKSICAPNTTGVVGVALTSYTTRSGNVLRRYCATWFDADGQRQQVTFSIRRYGRAAAFKLAVAARRHGLSLRFGAHVRTLRLLPARHANR